MAQKRYYDFEDELISYDFARLNLGMHRPGRYAGFDTLIPQSTLSFRLAHTATGISTVNTLGDTVGPLAYAVSNQGVIVEEDDDLPVLSIDTNSGNTSTRYDYVVMVHSYSSTPGGSSATYAVIKGPLSNPIFPTLSNPQTQVILGYLTIPPNATLITPADYTKAIAPDNGGEPDAKLNEVNIYTKLQQFKSGTDAGPTFDPLGTGEKLLTLSSDGNTYKLKGSLSDYLDGIRFKGSSAQSGCKISLVLTAGIGLTNQKALSTAASNSGYKAFFIPKSMQDGGSGITPPSNGEEKLVELLFINNQFLVTYKASTLGGQNSQLVSASPEDTKPLTLFEKLQSSDYIGYTVVDDLDKGKLVQGRVKGKEAAWDNVWKNITSTLDSNHNIAAGYTPRYKIDYFGKLILRDFSIIRVGSLAHNSTGTTTVCSLPITLPKDVIIPIHATATDGPYGLWASLRITSGGLVILNYYYNNMGSYTNPTTGLTMTANNVVLDITLNPG